MTRCTKMSVSRLFYCHAISGCHCHSTTSQSILFLQLKSTNEVLEPEPTHERPSQKCKERCPQGRHCQALSDCLSGPGWVNGPRPATGQAGQAWHAYVALNSTCNSHLLFPGQPPLGGWGSMNWVGWQVGGNQEQ